MKTNDSAALYANSFSIPEENRVPGFDPLRFLKMTSDGPKLDLSTKKVWFRLKYPQGRVILSATKIDQQLALIEARVFLNKSDTTPAFTSAVQRMLNEVPGGLYVQAAQNAAIEQVLDKAGFTVRCNGIPVPFSVQTPTAQNTPKADKVTVPHQSISSVNESKQDNKAIVQSIPETLPVVQTQPSVKQTVTNHTVLPEPVIEPIAKEEDHAEQDVQTSVNIISSEMVKPETVEKAKEEIPAQSVGENTSVIAETNNIPVLETIPASVEESTLSEVSENAVPYTTETPVEEICKVMSVDEAMNYVITTGSCKGWTMAQAIARRPASVRFYLTPGYKGNDNILRASAAIVMRETEKLAKAG